MSSIRFLAILLAATPASFSVWGPAWSLPPQDG